MKRRTSCRTGLDAALFLVLTSWVGDGYGAEPACERSDGGPVPAGCFTDEEGQLHDPAVEYGARLSAARPDHLRTMVEEVFFLGLGAAWYWIDQERNLADWDYPSWEQRFTLEAWRLDNNHFPINFLGHPLEGALYYSFARANDHNAWVATTYSYSTSFLWEFLFEFREKISINDMLVTPLAGLPIGEFAHKFWRHFSNLPAQPTMAQQVAAATLGFPIWIHRLMDGTSQPAAVPEDGRGFSATLGQRLEAGYRANLHDFGGQAMTHGGWLGGRLSSIPGEGRPGSFELFFHEADIVALSLAAGLGADARELELVADAVLLGCYVQAIDVDGSGHGAVLGAGLAYRYRFQDFDGYNDRLAILHLPGPAADYVFREGAAQLTVQARFNADFAAVHSAAFSRWARDAVGPADRAKSILRKHNYYYGWGGSSRFAAELRVGPLDLRGGLLVGVYDSQEGLDRTQDEITLDPDAVDRVFDWDTSMGFTVPSTSLRLAAGWRSTQRQSRVEQETVDRSLQTWSVSLGFGL